MKILVIGGGFMGTALATYFNAHGVKVSIYETFEKKRIELMNDIRLSDIQILDELCTIEDLDFIIEAIPENLEAKQHLFAKLEQLFPPNITLCTNTSSYLISEVAKLMEQKGRLIGTHFFSPANISPLVEVVPSEYTEQSRIEDVMALLKSMKKKPVLLKKEIEGFVANRLQSALAREAMSLVEKGIVSAEELDFIAKWSLGIRLANTGPLEQRDINGLDTHLAITKYVYPTLENRPTPLPILEEKCASGSLGLKTKKGFYNWETIDVQAYQSKKNNILNRVIEVVSEGDRKMKYKALVKNSAAKHDVKFVEYEVPELKDNECLIRVKAVGICGSDLHMYDGHGGYDWVTYPLVLGHEVVGEVIAVGNHNATEYLSKRVVIDPYKSCGQCDFCLRGETNRCDFNEFRTVKTPIEALRYGFREAGGMAQLMVVDIKNIIPIDQNVSDGVAAISEALAVSYTAVKKVEHFHSKRILVVGPGPIGFGVAAVLIGSGNKQVDMLGTAVDENRLKLSKLIGIKSTFMSEEEILSKDFKGYDAIIDCSGHPTVPQMAVRLLKRGGQLVLVGINSAPFSIAMDQIVRGEISIDGSYGITRRNYEEVLKLAAIPSYPFEKLIAEKVPFTQCTKGFEKALNKVSGKVVISM